MGPHVRLLPPPPLGSGGAATSVFQHGIFFQPPSPPPPPSCNEPLPKFSFLCCELPTSFWPSGNVAGYPAVQILLPFSLPLGQPPPSHTPMLVWRSIQGARVAVLHVGLSQLIVLATKGPATPFTLAQPPRKPAKTRLKTRLFSFC